jgi:cytochrome d ubiquinol oxidase subunit I
MLKTGVALGALLIPLQIFMGDLHGLNTKEHQPAKVAAMEGLWETAAGRAAPAVRDPGRGSAGEPHGEIGIPGLASLILTHEWDGELHRPERFRHRRRRPSCTRPSPPSSGRSA